MSVKTTLGKFFDHLSPGIFSAVTTYQAYQAQFKRVTILSGCSTLAEAIALALLYRLVLIFTSDTVEPLTDLVIANTLLNSTHFLSLTCAIFLILSIEIKRIISRKTILISELSGKQAGVMALTQARSVLISEGKADLPKKNHKSLVLFATKDVPFACGFAARSASSITFNLIQACFLSLILIYLSPLLTVAMLLIAMILIVYVSVSFETVIESNLERKESMTSYRKEVNELAVNMADADCNTTEFLKMIQLAIIHGDSSQQLSAKLSERRERQTGSLLIEYVYPIAVISISFMYVYMGDLAPGITELALYFLITRQVTISLYAVGSAFMSLSKHHRTLKSFLDLMEFRVLPQRSTDSE